MPLAVLDRSRFPDRRHALPMARHALALGSDSRHEALAASARAGSDGQGAAAICEAAVFRLPARR